MQTGDGAQLQQWTDMGKYRRETKFTSLLQKQKITAMTAP